MSAYVRAEGLHKKFAAGRRTWVHAVRDVSLHIDRGQTLGLVGESGCGKTTVGRMVLALEPPDEGRSFVGDAEVTALRDEPLRRFRKRMQMIFQDPFASLNPRIRIADSVAEPMRIHLPDLSVAERRARTDALLTRVGLRPELGKRLPAQLSGGQRQRIVIARALACEPELIFADEPVSALDVSVQAQIMNLLTDLQRERGLTFLFVSHDLKVVQHVAHRIAVMYLGRIVEEAPKSSFFGGMRHPYTQALLSAVPDPRVGHTRLRVLLEGEIPSPLRPPSGCSFHPRCPLHRTLSEPERARCAGEMPELRVLTGTHRVACHFAQSSATSSV